MLAIAQQPVIDFYRYPPVGGNDWRYVFQTAQVRAFEIHLLHKAALLDMVNAPGFEQALEMLRATDYALPAGARSFSEAESMLRQRRTAVRQEFTNLMLDKRIVRLFKSRDDFANLRLAVRRAVTDKPIGGDYGAEGNFPAERFGEVFEGENYDLLPDYMAEAAERAIVSFYQDKDIRRIDETIDAAQMQHNLSQAAKCGSEFLLGLFRIQVDLANIRTMLRLKLTAAARRNVWLTGGYVEPGQLQRGLDIGYEAIAALFFATPYFELVGGGAGYASAEKSFLKLEQQCDEYFTGYLRTTSCLTAGPQPIIAYLLIKENEIRTVRLILTSKKNHLDTKLILDRMG